MSATSDASSKIRMKRIGLLFGVVQSLQTPSGPADRTAATEDYNRYRQTTRAMSHKVLTTARGAIRRAGTEAEWLRSRRERADLAVFHEFRPPPYGGGNQF